MPIELKKTFKYRSCLMGIAMIWVVCRHCPFGAPGTLFSAIKETGEISMEIFMLMSGIGCWYSLEKNSNVGDFLWRRMLKIMPMYWCMIALWIVYRIIIHDMTFPKAVFNILAIEHFIDPENEFNWYITAIWVMYLLAPLFRIIIKKCGTMAGKLAVFASLLAFSLLFWNWDNALVIAYRVPSFFLGMCIASLDDDFQITAKRALIVFSALAIGIALLLLNHYMVYYGGYPKGLHGYMDVLIAPGLCLLFVMFFGLIDRTKAGGIAVNRLSRFGEHTFSVYLTHLFLFSLYIPIAYSGIVYALVWAVRIALIFPFSLLIEFLGKKLTALFKA